MMIIIITIIMDRPYIKLFFSSNENSTEMHVAVLFFKTTVKRYVAVQMEL